MDWYKTTFDQTKITDAIGNIVTTTNNDWLGRKTSESDADRGDWSYEYDDNDNLIRQTDAKAQVIVFTYDAHNRLTKKDYPSGADVYYYLDVLLNPLSLFLIDGILQSC